ncbi:hypothetical protein HRR90_002916, partial [Exophiala dermatitidis]
TILRECGCQSESVPPRRLISLGSKGLTLYNVYSNSSLRIPAPLYDPCSDSWSSVFGTRWLTDMLKDVGQHEGNNAACRRNMALNIDVTTSSWNLKSSLPADTIADMPTCRCLS